jgi:hypothetical protein
MAVHEWGKDDGPSEEQQKAVKDFVKDQKDIVDKSIKLDDEWRERFKKRKEERERRHQKDFINIPRIVGTLMLLLIIGGVGYGIVTVTLDKINLTVTSEDLTIEGGSFTVGDVYSSLGKFMGSPILTVTLALFLVLFFAHFFYKFITRPFF